MSRWEEILDGKYVDLDEVTAVERIGQGPGRSVCRLTVPGGTVEIDLPRATSTGPSGPSPTVSARPPWHRPFRWRKKARAAWDARQRSYEETLAENRRWYYRRDAEEWGANDKAATARYDEIVCLIGARDCDDGTPQ